jgi:hypothetical protein
LNAIEVVRPCKKAKAKDLLLEKRAAYGRPRLYAATMGLDDQK